MEIAMKRPYVAIVAIQRSSRLLSLILFFAGLCVAVPPMTARAAITPTGDVTPDPAGFPWDGTSYGYIGGTADGTLAVDWGSGLLSYEASIGDNAGAAGTVTIAGPGSTWKNGSTMYVGNSGSGTLNITGGGTVTSGIDTIGASSGSTGAATVDGIGSFWNNSGVRVGYSGTGTLSITGGGAVSSAYGSIGSDSYSGGTVTVDGAGSTWAVGGTLSMGDNVSDSPAPFSSSAALKITNGGVVSSGSSSIWCENTDAAVTVDGPGSTWNNSGSLQVGVAYKEIGDRATLRISNGGHVIDTSACVGDCGDGEVTVDGPGSTWTNSDGPLAVGLGGFGEGIVRITRGGAVTSNGGSIGSGSCMRGDVTVDGIGSRWTDNGGLDISSWDWPYGTGDATLEITNGGSVTSAGGAVGCSGQFQVYGQVTVSGAGSMWANSGGLSVGCGGNGQLVVNAGGAITSSSGGIGVGSFMSDGSGEVEIDGSTWNNTGDLDVGRDGGTGTLSITGGGTVTNTSAYVGWGFYTIGGGNFDRGSGAVTVAGVGSTWNNTGDLYVGYNGGTGILSITGGGTVTNTSAYVGWGFYMFGDGNFGCGSGAVTVAGSGSTWNNTGDLYVGYNGGTGMLRITDGGTVTSASACLGFGSSSEGTTTWYSSGEARVAGSGSTWANSGDLYVGNDGCGRLSITGGGGVSNTQGYIGYNSGSSGVVMVTGTGSTWTNRGDLFIGGSGSGTLKIANGGVVTAASASINSQSLLAIDVGNGSSLVDSGAFNNDGKVHISAGPSTVSGAYTPISAGAWGGTGTYQTLGGVWNSGSHVFSVSDAIAGTAGTPVTIGNLVNTQRMLISDEGGTGWSVAASFAATTEPTSVTLTASPIGGDTLQALQNLLQPPEPILGAWMFTPGDGYTQGDPVYLSFSIDPEKSKSWDNLQVWHFDEATGWTPYDASDLTLDGAYAGFTVTGFSGYAVAVPEPSTLALLAAATLGILVSVWRKTMKT